VDKKLVRGGKRERRAEAQRRPSGRVLLETLEARRLLSTSILQTTTDNTTTSTSVAAFAPTYEVYTSADAATTSASPIGFTPTEITTAYGINQVTFGTVTGTGAGQTIAIIDAYSDPDITHDLQAFDAAFGLANSTLTIESQTGSTTSLPTTDPAGAGNDNWEGETALDVEWAHATAPGAKLLLVEATDDSPSNIFAAINYARSVSGVSVVSMSFGGNETSGDTSYDSYFTTPSGHSAVAFVASTGDDAAPAGYPAYSPNVLAVGGTSLSIDSSDNYSSETGWSGSGGGISEYEAKPTYQDDVATESSTNRTAPDVAMDANPSTGVAVYDSYNNGTTDPWYTVGGTSMAAPIWAGIVTIADQGRAAAGEAVLDSSGLLNLIYSASTSDFHDITSGNNGYAAGTGYDLVTGRGTPIANLLIPYLVTGVATVVTNPVTTSGTLSVGGLTASATTISAGTELTLTATGVSDTDSSASVVVTFYEENNDVAGLQVGTNGDYAFTAVTNGSNAITLDTNGVSGTFTFYVQVTDSDGNASPTGSSAPTVAVTVIAGGTSTPAVGSVSATPNPVASGDSVTLTANNVTDVGGTVSRVTFYEETNGIAGLQTGPFGDLAFSSVTGTTISLSTDGVTGNFTFYAVATDNRRNSSATGTSAPSTSLTVVSGDKPDAPTDLTAATVSASAINLTFDEDSSNQEGFTIQRSNDQAFNTYTTVFTINSPTSTTYSDTGLIAGTTYYYRVQAFDLAGSSAFSNTASATTAGSVGSSSGSSTTALTTQYVDLLYPALLGRAADATGAAAGVAALDNGMSATGLVEGIINSQEYRQRAVSTLFERILDRSPTATELSTYGTALNATMTDQQVAAVLLGSQEFYDRSGDTTSGFINALYETALDRAPDSSGSSAFTAALNSGAMTRTQVAAAVTYSTEYRTILIQTLFASILDRSADSAGLAYYTAKLAAGSSIESVALTLATSSEVFTNRLGASGTLDTEFIDSVYEQMLGRDADAAALSADTAVLEASSSLAGRTAILQGIEASTEYRNDVITKIYERYLGRGPTSGELTSWGAYLAGGATQEQMTAQVVGSTEYLNLHGTATSAFLDAAFDDLTGAAASSSSSTDATLTSELNAQSIDTTQAALTIEQTSAYQTFEVSALYQEFLARMPDSAGLSYAISTLAAGTQEAVMNELITSDEYFNKL
jgi:hypothetical protein